MSETTTTMGTINEAIYAETDVYSDLVYLMDKDDREVARQYHSIKANKHIVAAYSISGRHCLVLFVDGQVKKVKKKNSKSNKNFNFKNKKD